MTESTKKFIDLAYKNGQPEKLQQQLTVIKQKEGILPVKTHASIFANKSIIIKDKDHTIRNILIFLFFSLIMIFCIDIRSAIHSELNRLKIQTMHCHQEYIENQCEIAVDAIRDKCKELLQCSHRVAQNEIKITQISGKLLGKAIHGIIDNTNLTGLIFLIIMILTIILLAYKSSKAEVKITEKHE